jgi:hypothetical protein
MHERRWSRFVEEGKCVGNHVNCLSSWQAFGYDQSASCIQSRQRAHTNMKINIVRAANTGDVQFAARGLRARRHRTKEEKYISDAVYNFRVLKDPISLLRPFLPVAMFRVYTIR